MKLEQEIITVKIPNAIGEAIISTNLFRNLKRNTNKRIIAISETINKQFLENLDYIDEVKGIEKGEKYQRGENEIFLDVSDYQKGKDVNNALPEHRTRSTKHLSGYMIEEAEKQLEDILNEPFKIDNGGLGPEINLTLDEEDFGYREIRKIEEKNNNFVIGIHTISSTENKNWPKEYWQEFISRNKKNFNFIEFLAPGQEPVSEDIVEERYKLRECASVIKACEIFIGIDSFGIHAAKAVSQENVITIFGSSNPEVYSYESFSNLYSPANCKYQPCGRHSYDLPIGCTLDERKEDEKYTCMRKLMPEDLQYNLEVLLYEMGF